MATEKDPAGTPTAEAGAEQKVTFTAEQQAKVQELINAAVGRVAASTRSESDAKLADLNRQLEEAKDAAKHATSKAGKADANADVSALQAQIDESKGLLNQFKGEIERYKGLAVEKEREAAAARQESLNTRKEVAIAESASKIPFFSLEVVKTLTKDKVQWDGERGQFVVKGDNGQVRLDSSLEKPMSLDMYFAEFAAANKYLVRADVHQGAGSSEASRTNVASNGRYEVADIFGPKSDSRKAADLMKTNPAEYKRLKDVARGAGLVA